MSFGEPSKIMGWTIPEAEALPVIKHAFDLGINTWDTVCAFRLPKLHKENTNDGYFRLTSILMGAQNASLEKPFENTRFLESGWSSCQKYLADYLKT
jgi:hypothetical protein